VTEQYGSFVCVCIT